MMGNRPLSSGNPTRQVCVRKAATLQTRRPEESVRSSLRDFNRELVCSEVSVLDNDGLVALWCVKVRRPGRARQPAIAFSGQKPAPSA